jgi:hypothetical protein
MEEEEAKGCTLKGKKPDQRSTQRGGTQRGVRKRLYKALRMSLLYDPPSSQILENLKHNART